MITGKTAALASVLLVIHATIPCHAQSAGQSSGVSQYYDLQRVDSLIRARRYDDAAPVLERVIARDSTQGDAVYLLGQLRERAGDCPAANALLVRAWNLGFGNGPYTALSIARCFARVRARNATLAWLDTALAHKLDGRTSLASDTAFAFLRTDAEFMRRAAVLPDTVKSRTAGWRFDIALFAEEAKRLHAGTDRRAFSPAFDARIRLLSDQVPQLSDAAIRAELLRLTVTLGDGHSNLWPPGRQSVLQMNAYEFSDGLYLIDAPANAREWIGSRILRIGAVPVETLRDSLAPFEHRDNEMSLRWTFPVYTGLVPLLRQVGAIESDSGAWLLVHSESKGDGRIFIPADTVWRERKLFPPPNGSAPPPLYLQHVDRNYWMEYLPANRALYWQFNQVWSMPGFPIPALADSLWRVMTTRDVRTLILDMRLNNGGNAVAARPLLGVLQAFQQSDPSRRIFVISGRGTFSAAQIFMTSIEQYTNAVFVGEPSSSSPNFVGEDGSRLRLPYSGTQVNISFKRHQGSAYDDRRHWIPVSVPVALSSADYFANRDPALAAILEIIRR